MARASSGSMPSSRSIDPLMSANSVVTVLRSPSSEASAVPVFTCIGKPASGTRCNLPPTPGSGFAHSRQNFAVGGFSALHDGHRRTNGEAHSTQNFARSGFSAPHFEQRIGPPRSNLDDQRMLQRSSGIHERRTQRRRDNHAGLFSSSSSAFRVLQVGGVEA